MTSELLVINSGREGVTGAQVILTCIIWSLQHGGCASSQGNWDLGELTRILVLMKEA